MSELMQQEAQRRATYTSSSNGVTAFLDVEEPRDVQVICGANEGKFPVAGKSVAMIRRSLRNAFNMDSQAEPYVDGVLVDENYVTIHGQQLEFIKLSGKKG